MSEQLSTVVPTSSTVEDAPSCVDRAAEPEQDYTQEVRFAVVLYGGVSLAVYINGVVQELFRMVRSTAKLPPDSKLCGTERIYRELGQLLFHGRNAGADGAAPPRELPDSPVRTRFVVDVISGSSAGGINGVFLAKALALKKTDLKAVQDIWMQEANLETLLNDKGSDLRRYPNGPRSLLNSRRMYGLLLDALKGMNPPDGPSDAEEGFADEIDLFITATDLNGVSAPVQLTDRSVDESTHRAVFRFTYEDTSLDARKASKNPVGDFAPEFDPMLAFAARCTSSFPVAFEPVSLRQFEKELRDVGADFTQYSRFFTNFSERNIPFADRPLADGGYLDNKPFSHAIQQIEHRSSRRPVQRKLIYVEPSPERDVNEAPRTDYSFVENAYLAASGLPRYETIREDIDRVTNSNKIQRRLKTWRERIERDYRRLPSSNGKPSWRKLGKNFHELDLEDMVSEYNVWYLTYHHIRVYDVTDWLAQLFTRLAGLNAESDQYYAVRMLAKSWRDAHYSSYRENGKATENEFLLRYDVDFQLRLSNHLRTWIDEELLHASPTVMTLILEARKLVLGQQRALRELRETLSSPLGSPLAPSMVELLAACSWKEINTIIGEIDRQEKFDRADEVYRAHQGPMNELMEQLDRELQRVFLSHGVAIEQFVKRDAPGEAGEWMRRLREEYQSFDWHDMLSLTFLEGSRVKEHTEVEIYRVSPMDSDLKPKNGKKLAGTAVGNFGAFLASGWRENDLMWGRLDGAEQIVRALLPHPRDKELRDHYVQRVRDAILEEELSPLVSPRVYSWLAEQLREKVAPGASARELREEAESLLQNSFPMLESMLTNKDYQKFVACYYRAPDGPSADAALGWVGRASRILGKMIDELSPGKKKSNRLAWGFQTSGVILTQLVRFSIPHSIGERIRDHWMWLVALAALLLVISAPVFGEPVARVGYLGLAVSLGGVVAFRSFRRFLRGEPMMKGAVRVAAIAVLAFLTLVGLWTSVSWFVSEGALPQVAWRWIASWFSDTPTLSGG